MSGASRSSSGSSRWPVLCGRIEDSRMRKPVIAALMAFAILPIATPGLAAEWPARPIRIIAPSTPGGAADTFSRLLAEFLPPLLHQPVIVDNRAGAGGLIGAAAVAHA